MDLLERFTFGVGDRFAHQASAQLIAFELVAKQGAEVIPVWNKSNREHQIIGSSPADTRLEADHAVSELGWKHPYYVDADHINIVTVKPFMEYSDFFTLDVADAIGSEPTEEELENFLELAGAYTGEFRIPGIEEAFHIPAERLKEIAGKFLGAISKAAAIYRKIEAGKGGSDFIAEVSMDEVQRAQTPEELLFILLMISHYQIPAQTIAPKFTGRFNKGVDYAGDLKQFRKEFEEDLLVIDFAVKTFGLPENLKLSIHSGSDKFSIYPIMGELIRKHDKGIHVKTAGTTWLEEIIGLALAGGDALAMAKNIYSKAYCRQEELCGPYETVIDIDPATLPLPPDVDAWDGKRFAAALRHEPGAPHYDAGFRQLLHVGYKVAAEMGDEFLNMVRQHGDIVAEQVGTNIYERHIKRLFS